MFVAVFLVTLIVCTVVCFVIGLAVGAKSHLQGKAFPKSLIGIMVAIVLLAASFEAAMHARMAGGLEGTYKAFEKDAWPSACGRTPYYKGDWSEHLENRDAMLESAGYTRLGGWHFYADNCHNISAESHAMYFWLPWR